MKAFVIAPPDGGRHEPLIRQLKAVPKLDVIVWPARMISSIPPDYDVALARAMNNLDLTPGEIGCASSHRDVWLEASVDGDEWSLVLEDDARITDVDELARITDEVRSLRPDNPATVISLYSEGAVLRRWPVGRFAPCRAEPSSAVAYFLTPKAAELLARANVDLKFRADWPRASGVDFWLVIDSMVRHGDPQNRSLVGDRMADPMRTRVRLDGLSGRKLSNRLSLYLFLHYLRHTSQFDGPIDYFRKVLRHRFIWHFARLTARDRRRIGRHYVLAFGRRPSGTP